MSTTTDTGNLFQSDDQHAKQAFRAAKTALHADTGNPIKLGSKPLRTVVRQVRGREADAWVGESGFVVRKVGLESGKTKQLYRGHTGPVTSLAFYTAKGVLGERELLISGSWDKSFRVWDTATKTHLSTTVGHTDFVKALTVIPELDLLVSGSSDKDIRLWDLSPLNSLDFASITTLTARRQADSMPPASAAPTPAQTGAAPPAPASLAPLSVVRSLKAHTRPIERLASYQILKAGKSGEDEDRLPTGRFALVSVDSLGALKVWEVWRDEAGEVQAELRSESRPHEIGIYDLVISADTNEMWTASTDNSVLLSTFDPTNPASAPVPTLRIPHPTYTKSLLSLPLALPSLGSSHLLTGASDEHIRIFDLSSLEPDAPGAVWSGNPAPPGSSLPGLVREVEGHAHDVVDLGVYTVQSGEGQETKTECWVLSASLDGTLRRWKWPEVLVVPKERTVLVPVEIEEESKGGMTAEEERELQELMDELSD